MKLFYLSFAFFLINCCLATAEMDPPLENDLFRAESVMIARVVSVSAGDEQIVFHPTEFLRGNASGEHQLALKGSPGFKIGSEYLLISQGDARCGPPHPRVGRDTTRGQVVWTGWLGAQIFRDGNRVFAEGLFSFRDKERFQEDIPIGQGVKGLSLPFIKQLVKEFPYQPNCNDDPEVLGEIYRAKELWSLEHGLMNAESLFWVSPRGSEEYPRTEEDRKDQEAHRTALFKRGGVMKSLIFFIAGSPEAVKLEKRARELERKFTLLQFQRRAVIDQLIPQMAKQADQIVEEIKRLPKLTPAQAQKEYEALVDENYRSGYKDAFD